MTQTVAFIGLGNMGLPMAKNLLAAGLHVQGFDLSPEAKAGLMDAGGIACDSVSVAVHEADVVITMLPNGSIVRKVYLEDDGILDNATPGALFIDSSTIDVATAREVIAAATARGFDMVDGPVSGGVGGAASGTLAFMVGGTDKAFKRAQPVLKPMAGKIVHTGGAGNGQATKLCNNMVLAITMIATGEAFNLGRALGVNDQVLYDVMSNASAQSWSLTSYCPVPGPVQTSPANKGYEPGFATDLMLKDLRLALEAIDDTGANSPMGEKAHDLYAAMAKAGLGGKDFSAMITYLSAKK